MIRVNARIELSCGCTRSPRNILPQQVPAIGALEDCFTHGLSEVIHTSYVGI